jgi:predicted metal-dependent HD superfamily phosphohydrolase
MSPHAGQGLQIRWMELLAGLGIGPEDGAAAFSTLAAHYHSPGRHYHTLDHIAAMLDSLANCGEQAPQDDALLLAVWFHDAVYNTRAQDNEEQSAALAGASLRPLGLADSLLAEVQRLILLTKSHQADVEDRRGRLLLDVDLEVLGRHPAHYDAYAAAIRREYSWVHEEAYRAGRRRVLEGFLQRPQIYTTQSFALLEQPARANLRREVSALANPP